jgi:hypothetical protein
MEIPQGNSQYHYLYCKQEKLSFFSLSFSKKENRRAEQVLPGVGTSGRGEEVGKGCKRLNGGNTVYTCS